MTPLAILGRGCVLPGALSPDDLWTAVAAGRDLTSDPPAGRWGVDPATMIAKPGEKSLADKSPIDRALGGRGGYVRGFEDVWDPEGFAVPAAQLAGLDPVFLWLLHSVRAAWREAALAGVDPKRVGVVVGALSYPTRGLADFARAVWRDESLEGLRPENRFSSGYPAQLAAKALGLEGPAFALDAACASSLYALKIAGDALDDGRADAMVVAAVNACDSLFLHMGFTALGALSKSGASRPFSRRADGLLPAEGAAAVVLSRAEGADPKRVRGLVRGVGISNDGRRRGLLAPDADGQREALQRAYRAADVDPATVSLIECHATGTPTGDPLEILGLKSFFARALDLPAGSLKSNTGHLITAAGLGGILKLLGALAHETRPKTLHADDAIDAFGGVVRPLLANEPWPGGDAPRRAGLSAFGFGGNNAHLVLEEWRPRTKPRVTAAARPPADDIVICGVGASAGDVQGLREILAQLERPAPATPTTRRGEITLDLARVKLPPADLKKALAQQTLMIEVVDEALRGVALPAPERVGVIVGMGCDPEAARWALRWRDAADPAEKDAVVAPLDAAFVLGAMPNVPANRLNVLHDWRGCGFTVSSEELSGTDALEVAAAMLRRGELDLAVVGAVDLSDEPVHAEALRRLDPTVAPGDAAAALVLKRRTDAERKGDVILCSLGGELDNADDDAPVSQALARRFGTAHAASALLSLVVAAAAGARDRAIDERGARALLAPAPRLSLSARSTFGRSAATVLSFDAPPLPSGVVECPPWLAIFAAADERALAERLTADTQGGDGPVRIALLADDGAALAALRHAAADGLRRGRTPSGLGVRYAASAVGGEMAFVFTGAAAAYAGMARALFAAFPDAGRRVAVRFGEAQDTADRLARDPGMLADPFEQLRATTLVSQVHAEIALDLLKLKPAAALGLSSGETNALLAFGAWRDPDALLAEVRESGMYDRWLAGRCEAAGAVWGVAAGTAVVWRCWRVLAPVEAVRAAVEQQPRVTVTIVNGPSDCVIAGEAEACRRALTHVKGASATPLGQDMVVHCAEAAPFADEWRRIHRRETFPVDGVRFYANALNGPYRPTRETAAEMLTEQAVQPIDFTRTIERAWTDGVRLFIELGPRDTLARAIGEVLRDRPHVAVAFDRFDRGDVAQIADAAAALWVAGAEIDIAALQARLTALAADLPAPAPAGAPLVVAAHQPPVPRPATRTPAAGAAAKIAANVVALPRAPRLAPTTERAPARVVASAGSQRVAAAPRLAVVTAFARTSPPPPCEEGVGGGGPTSKSGLSPSLRPMLSPPPPPPLPRKGGGRRGPLPPASLAPERPPIGPAFSREQLESATRGKVSDLFGPAFARQDGFARQVRMPAPPLLLADRVTGIDADAGVLGKGTIWTETTVAAADWRTHAGRLRPGIVIESGQADLLLVSYMGADFLNQGERIYRLLGCELTFHEDGLSAAGHEGGPPAVGETLRFQINIERHAKVGDVRLFFFDYDARVGDRPLLSVRNGQAGFFTDTELAASSGVLWDAETSPPPTPEPRLSALPRTSRKHAFTARELDAFHAGDALACFGPGFERACAHQRTPRPPSGRLRMIDRVEAFEPAGGPWKRGYLRAAAAAAADAWFYDGHFHNDPCMPGTLMAEAAVQAVELFMVAAGLTVERDGWRFEPMPGEAYQFVCRGQVVPDRDHALTYEVFVDEIVDGPEPVVYAALLARSDDFKVFSCPRFGVRLKRDWPISDRAERALIESPRRIVSPGGDVGGDYGALTACAWGKPSDAFGSMYARFDRESSVPRLPGPPYHVVSRILSVSHPSGAPAKDITVIAEYDPPEDAWYFDANGHAVMPFSVLMEVLLQPCGWLASYCGFAVDGGLAFRNLDGEKAVARREVRPGDGPLRVTTRLSKWSKVGPMTIVFFEVDCRIGDDPVMAFATSFGFFPAAALASQAGLPTTDALKARLSEPADRIVTPKALAEGQAAVPRPPLSMIDAVTGFWAEGGEKGLGRIRGRQVVDPCAWYFKAHFYEDPVQPGSLGIEALLQLLEHAMRLKGLDRELASPRFEAPALGVAMTWKYRGQVTPTAKEVVTTLDVTSIERGDGVVLATAKASLWADGLRIYEADGLSARIVEGEPARTRRAVMSLELQPWLADHRPTWTLPAVPMAGVVAQLGALAQEAAPEPFPLVLDDLTLLRWIVVGDAPGVLDATAAPRGGGRFALTLAADGKPAAQGWARVGGPAPAFDSGPELGCLAPIPDLYAEGGLFHGPRFQLLTNVARSSLGAIARLDVGRAFDPDADLDIGLIDALLHAIPHDAPELWWGSAAAGFAAYPHTVERLVVHGPRPRAGTLDVRVHLLEATPQGRFVRAAVRAEHEGVAWLELVLREALMPKGPLGRLTPADRRGFLAEGRFVAGAGLSKVDGEDTVLALADVAASDWLPGTLAAAYGLAGVSDDLARPIAIKDHAARIWGVHPWTVAVEGDVARMDEQSLNVVATFDAKAQRWRVSTRKAP